MTCLETPIIILFALTMLYVAVSSRLELYVKMLVVQGVLLFVLAMLSIPLKNTMTLAVVTVETLVLKAGMIPFYLTKVIRENDIQREAEPYIPNLYSLMIVCMLTAVGFFFSFWTTKQQHSVNPLFFGVAVAVILSALFILMSRKKLITHIIAYVFLENGIFLLSLSVAHDMPFIINLGIALDAFAWVLLAGFFVRMIQNKFSDQHIDRLKGLRG